MQNVIKVIFQVLLSVNCRRIYLFCAAPCSVFSAVYGFKSIFSSFQFIFIPSSAQSLSANRESSRERTNRNRENKLQHFIEEARREDEQQ
jgi:hypothetical protein